MRVRLDQEMGKFTYNSFCDASLSTENGLTMQLFNELRQTGNHRSGINYNIL